LGDFIANKGFVVHLLSTPSDVNFTVENDDTDHAEWLGASWRIDAEQTLAALGSMEVDWLVVDHYALDARWEKLLAKAVCQIMVIDDLADRHHDCDLLLDQNLGREIADYDYKVPEHCTRLIGPKYALLRPEFARLREKSLERRKTPELKRILLSLGGVDRTNVTAQVLSALNDSPLSSETKLEIIMGAAAPYLNDIRTQASHTRFRTTISVNVGDMAERMCRADLSVGAAGSTSWERCCLGLPAIIVVLADNQRSAANALGQQGVAIVAKNPGKIPDALNQLLSIGNLVKTLTLMSELGADLIKGEGCLRVVEELIKRSAKT